MLCSYKFWYIKRDDSGFITEAAIRFYEGDITTLSESVGVSLIATPVTRYRRVRKLQEDDLRHLKSKKIKKDSNNQDSIVYNPEDFGQIKTDDELKVFLNSEIIKDPMRIPINEQKLA